MRRSAMEKLNNHKGISHLLEQLDVEKVYPLSIMEGLQRGQVYVDDTNNPSIALIWHYCGFANIVGKYDIDSIHDIQSMMHDPAKYDSKRMALQIGTDSKLEKMILSDSSINKRERYIFHYSGEKMVMPEIADCELTEITSENYDLIYGKIIPAFSWESKEHFLHNGYGYCLMKDKQFLACAFSSGISKDYVDIGVETAEEFRGKGYGKIVAFAMVKETLKRKKTPVWGCDILNEGSMRLACSVGFEVCGTHPWYKI